MSFMVVTASDPAVSETKIQNAVDCWMGAESIQPKFPTALDKPNKGTLTDMYLSDPNLAKYRTKHGKHKEKEEKGKEKKIKGKEEDRHHHKKDKEGEKKKKRHRDEKAEESDTPESTRIFGVPIEVAAQRSDRENWLIPSPIRSAVKYINERAFDEEGLYRIPGSHSKYLEYKSLFDSGKDVDFLEVEKIPQNVTMMIIKYLQELPEPLYTNALLPRFKKVLFSVKEKDRQTKLLRKAMEMLPFVNREVFRFLVNHLRFLSLHRSSEQMHGSIMSWGISLGQLMGRLMDSLCDKEFDIPQTVVFGVEVQEAGRRSHKQGCIPSPIRFAAESLLVFRNGRCFEPFAFSLFPSTCLVSLSFQCVVLSFAFVYSLYFPQSTSAHLQRTPMSLLPW